MQSQRQCFDVYEVHIDPVEETDRGGMREPQVLKTRLIIPSVNDSGNLTLNVTTNSTLSTNTFYRAKVIAATGMVDVGSSRFCKYTVT